MHRLANFAVVALVALCGGCVPCDNLQIGSQSSPDRLRTAILFHRDCGATAGFSTQISIVRGEHLPNEPGNIFVADTNHGAAPAALWGGPLAQMMWLDSATLEVRYDPRGQVLKRVEAIDGVSIRYVPLGDA